MGGGISSAVARALGAGRRDDADALSFHALAIGVIFGLAFMLGALVGGPLALRGDGRKRAVSRGGADLFQCDLLVRDPGLGLQLARQRDPRHRQHGVAGHRDLCGCARR